VTYGLILGLAAAAIAAAALTRSVPLMVAAVAALIVALLVEGGRRRALHGVSVRRTVSRRVVSWGGEVEVITEVRNGKWLPLPWLRVTDRWPLAVEPLDTHDVTRSPSGRTVRQAFSLRWQETVRRRVRARCLRRGLQRFGPVELVAGDPLGFTETSLEVPASERLVVLPKVLRPAGLHLPLSLLPGEIDRRLSPVVDAARLAGVRPYRRGDPARAINWRATARRRALHVSEFEPAAESPVLLLLDLRTSAHVVGGFDAQLFELLIVTAASLATALDGAGCSVGLLSNAQTAGSRAPLELEPEPEGLPALLTTLGSIALSPAHVFEPLLAAEVRAPRPTVGYVVVTSRLSPTSALLLARLRRRAPLSVVFVGEPPAGGGREVDLYLPGGFDWEHEDVLALA